MTEARVGVLPESGTQVTVDGQLVTVLAATPNLSGADLVYRRGDGSLDEASLDAADLARAHVPANDAGGHPERALTGVWGRWMQYAVPRIRSAVLATRPLRYAHRVFVPVVCCRRFFVVASRDAAGTVLTCAVMRAIP